MKILTLVAMAFCTIPATLTAASPNENPPKYLLSMKLTQGSQILASPRLLVLGNEESKVDIGSEGGRRFTMSVRVEPGSAETIDMRSRIQLVAASGKQQSFSPQLTVKLGEASTIEVGDQTHDDGAYRIDFSISKAIETVD